VRLFVHTCSGLQDFNWYSASRGPSASAELLVFHYRYHRGCWNFSCLPLNWFYKQIGFCRCKLVITLAGGMRSIVVNMSICLSVRSHSSKTTLWTSPNFCAVRAVARSSADGVMIRYVMYFRFRGWRRAVPLRQPSYTYFAYRHQRGEVAFRLVLQAKWFLLWHIFYCIILFSTSTAVLCVIVMLRWLISAVSVKQRSGVCPSVCLSHVFFLKLMRLWLISSARRGHRATYVSAFFWCTCFRSGSKLIAFKTLFCQSHWFYLGCSFVHCKNIHILTEPVPYTLLSVNRRNNEARAQNCNVGLGFIIFTPVKICKTRHKMSMDVRIFFGKFVLHLAVEKCYNAVILQSTNVLDFWPIDLDAVGQLRRSRCPV